MQAETAKMLVESMATTLGIAIDNRNKLTALEKVLQDRDPELFQEYEKTLQKVREYPPTSLSPLGFSNLQARLARD